MLDAGRLANAMAIGSARSDPLLALDRIGRHSNHGRGTAIYRQDDMAEHWYRVRRGIARKCLISADGRRQIVDFLLPGDFFGMADGRRRRFSVEAVVDSTVVDQYPSRAADELADRDRRLARCLRDVAFQAASRLEARALILGRMSAADRVGAFLIEFEQRLPAGEGGTFILPMSRYDIGDYLSLSAETVIRMLTDLRHSGAVRFLGRHRVQILDRSALDREINADAAAGPRASSDTLTA